MIGEGRSINVTLIFSLDRYDEVMEAYLAASRTALAAGATDLSARPQRGVVLRQPGRHRGRPAPRDGGRRAGDGTAREVLLAVRGTAAVAQAQQAYRAVRGALRRAALGGAGGQGAPRCSDRCGPRPRPRTRPTPICVYVDTLIGPDTVNTMPDETIAAFLDHGTVARTVDADPRRPPALEHLGHAWASTWPTWPRPSRTKGWPASPSPSTSCMQSLSDKANALAAGA